MDITDGCTLCSIEIILYVVIRSPPLCVFPFSGTLSFLDIRYSRMCLDVPRFRYSVS